MEWALAWLGLILSDALVLGGFSELPLGLEDDAAIVVGAYLAEQRPLIRWLLLEHRAEEVCGFLEVVGSLGGVRLGEQRRRRLFHLSRCLRLCDHIRAQG